MTSRKALCLLAALTGGMVSPGVAAQSTLPFAGALDRADVVVSSLDSILEDALLVGNGNINGLVFKNRERIILQMTRNDIWDARLLTENDPPLPTLQRLEEIASGMKEGTINWILPEGMTAAGGDSYNANPFPCPVACGRLVVGEELPADDLTSVAAWKVCRSEGRYAEWLRGKSEATMAVEGGEGASCGFTLTPVRLSTDNFPRIGFTVRGSNNARYYVDVMDESGENIHATGWTDTPTEPSEVALDLPPGRVIGEVILYTWTTDGERAENHFGDLRFVGDGSTLEMPMPPDRPAPDSPPAARLSLRQAVVRVEGPGAAAKPRALIRALWDRSVFLIETGEPVAFEPAGQTFLPEPKIETVDGVEIIEQQIPGDLDWPGMRFAVALARGEGCAAVAIATSRDSDNPRMEAHREARSALQAGARELAARHEASWREFWSASGVELGNRYLESTWYRNLYFLRCVTREGVISPGLFASLTSDTPAWHGDYHTNYNIQQTFWTSLVTNHPDLAEPYDRLVREYLPRARWLARKVYDCEGAFYPHVMYAYEPPEPDKCRSVNGRQYIHHVWGMTLGVAGFTVQPLWWRYKYDPDIERLRDTVYPPLRDVATFYADFIERCEKGENGRVRFGPTVSPEHWGWTAGLDRNYDCAFDIGMVRYTLDAAVEAAGALDCDAALSGRWKQAAEVLPDYPVTEVSGETIVVDVTGAPPINYNISVPATPVYPGDVVTAWSPEETKNLFRRTIQNLQWNGNNATFMLAISRARLDMPDTAGWLETECRARQRPNGTLTLNRLGAHFNAFGHYTEQFAAAQAVSELLVQSVGDVVRVFPAWDVDTPARFENLRTQGGFLVSATCEQGKTGVVEITSTVGGTLRVAPPWPRTAVKVNDKARDSLLEAGRAVLRIDTQPGDRIVLIRKEDTD